MNRIIRVFPRRTKATPDDAMAFIGDPPLFRPAADEVHVSCTFTWDKPEAKRLAAAWGKFYPTKLGGPAYDDPGGEFVPGKYLKPGYTITTRGCPNKCWFCFVPKREGQLRELPICPGWDVLDNNLLAASRGHVEAVMAMLHEQPRPVTLSGGLDVEQIKPWWVNHYLRALRIRRVYIAYDRQGQRPSLERVVPLLRDVLSQRALGCYVLVGFPRDTLAEAESRLQWVFSIGATPFAMYFRPAEERQAKVPADWRALVRRWCRPAAIYAHAGKGGGE